MMKFQMQHMCLGLIIVLAVLVVYMCMKKKYKQASCSSMPNMPSMAEMASNACSSGSCGMSLKSCPKADASVGTRPYQPIRSGCTQGLRNSPKKIPSMSPWVMNAMGPPAPIPGSHPDPNWEQKAYNNWSQTYVDPSSPIGLSTQRCTPCDEQKTFSLDQCSCPPIE